MVPLKLKFFPSSRNSLEEGTALLLGASDRNWDHTTAKTDSSQIEGFQVLKTDKKQLLNQ